MKVLPLPVAIRMSDRGRFAASDFSRLQTVSICAAHMPVVTGADIWRSRARSCSSSPTMRSSSSGRGKEKGRVLRVSQSQPPQPRWLCKTIDRMQLRRTSERLGRLWLTRRTQPGEDFAAPRVRVEVVGEPRGLAGGLVAERQRLAVTRQSLRQSFEVLTRLRLDPGERGANLLRFDDTDHLRVGVEQVVREPSGERELPHRDAGRGADVVSAVVLHQPPGLSEEVIDPLPGLCFGCHRVVIGVGMAVVEVR